MMDEDDLEIDCSLFASATIDAIEEKHVERSNRPRPQKAWSHHANSLEIKPAEKEIFNMITDTNPGCCTRPNEIAQVSAEKSAVVQGHYEDFTICKKCLSNRNEFEESDNTALSQTKLIAENLNSSKEICICAMDNNFDQNLNALHEVDKRLVPIVADEDIPNCYNIFDLPDEIMLKIFSFFTPTELCRYVAPVCVAWLAYARDSTLWEEITAAEFKDVASDLLVKVITSWCSLLRLLDLKDRTDMSRNDLKAIFESCPHIENLSFAFCDQIDDNMMKILSDYCSELKYINFEGCKISDSALIYLFGKPIHGLNLSHCNMISDEGITFLAKNFDKLISLDLDGVQWVSQVSIEVLVNLHAENLVDVILDGAELFDDSTRILSRCHNIRKFSISFCDSLTDDSLEWIKQFQKLEYLQLKKGTNFTNVAILSLLQSLQNMEGQGLRYLNLSECSSLSDECLHALSQSCPNLVILNLSWCWEVTDDGINFIFDSCHKIKELHLCGLHELYGIPFRRVQREMPKLTYLDLRQCNKTSDDLLTDLASDIKTLKILNYYGDVVKASLNFWNLESKCSPGHYHHTSI